LAYQVLILDSFGAVVRTLDIECADDEAARTVIEGLAGVFALELWAGERLVERYETAVN
jgi:hypothetical protein